MDATIVMDVSPRTFVPEKGRVEWLEKFGVLPLSAKVSVTATLKAWHLAGAEVRADGSIVPGWQLSDELSAAVKRLVAETGQVPEALPTTIVEAVLRGAAARVAADRVAEEARLAGLAADAVRNKAEAAAREAERARIRALPAEALIDEVGGKWVRKAILEWATSSTQDEAAKDLCAKRNAEPMRAWVAAHGSARLKLAVEMGLWDAIEKSYLDERLAAEREGWRYEHPGRGYDVPEEIIEPSLEVLTAFAEARKTDPTVDLVFLVTKHDDDCQGEGDCTCDATRGPALRSNFLGRVIVKDLK